MMVSEKKPGAAKTAMATAAENNEDPSTNKNSSKQMASAVKTMMMPVPATMAKTQR